MINRKMGDGPTVFSTVIWGEELATFMGGWSEHNGKKTEFFIMRLKQCSGQIPADGVTQPLHASALLVRA